MGEKGRAQFTLYIYIYIYIYIHKVSHAVFKKTKLYCIQAFLQLFSL